MGKRDKGSRNKNKVDIDPDEETSRQFNIFESRLPSIEALICEQKAIADEIKVIWSNYESTSRKERTKGYIKTRISGVESCWEKFRSNHRSMVSQASADQKMTGYFTNKFFNTTEKLYSQFCGELYDALDVLISLENPSGNSLLNTATLNIPTQADNGLSFLSSPNVKLPRIDIPKFSGSYRNWRSFYDLFSTLIHDNDQVPKVQKLYFLKTSLEGEAARLIRHLDIVEKNYDAAWDLLTQRYDNKRVIVNSQLKILTSQSAIKYESPQAIKQLLDTTNECLHSLRSLEVKVDYWDEIIIFLLIQKLPTDTRELWERSLENSKDLPKLGILMSFLESRFRTLEMVKGHGGSGPSTDTPIKFKKETRTFHIRKSSACPLCNKAHILRQCSQFLQMTPSVRSEVVSKASLCHNCLANSHPSQGCSNPKRCFHCNQRHHTLLHQNLQSADSKLNLAYHPAHVTRSSSNGTHNTESRLTSLHVDQMRSSFLLATAQVLVITPIGKHLLRALIDPGSQGSFIREDAAQKLGLSRHRVHARISGISTQSAGTATSQMQLTFQSIHDESFECSVNAFVLKSLTGVLPSQPIQARQQWHHINGLALADPTYGHPGRIDILLGVDVYASLILPGLRKGDDHSPVAQNTYLGWILFGEIKNTNSSSPSASNIVTLHSCIEEDTLLKLFWELEESPQEKILSKEDIECEDFYKTTHRRLESGRYEVRLPFVNQQPPLLGRSRDRAVNRLLQLERRLEKNPELYRLYDECLQDYLNLNHMKLAVTSEHEHMITSDSAKLYTVNYLPHHAVLKDSSTTKLRVVFDASSQSSNGLSLNDCLLTGPKLQEDLITILMRWRKHKIAFTADVTKMYRQIRVAADDVSYQRILWRNSPKQSIEEYDLNTVTFGTSCAPYLAIRTLKQLAEDEKSNYPLAYSVVKNDFYVDDVMSGADDIQSALRIQEQLISMLNTGGFDLRKWASNCFGLLDAVDEEKREMKVPLNIEESNMIKTLGLYWNPVKDYFSFKVSLEPASPLLTKRSLLSEISRLFDPIGWLTPSIILAKILMQQLWLTGISWDEQVTENTAHRWSELKNELYLFEHVKISRWLAIVETVRSIQLHGFCDSSTFAYCAVVYIRCVDEYGKIYVNLIAAKSKVAPIKPITLPRLELCAAVLLAKLLHYVKHHMKFDNATIYAWTDSKIVISWILGKPNKWKTFVCNRVASIQDRLDCSCWHHVASSDNPADCGSRGILPSSLIKHHLWWNGPKWLMYHEDTWPSTKTSQFDTSIDLKIIRTHLTETSYPLEILHKYSSLHKLTQITALCFRFFNNCRAERAKRKIGFLTAEEMRNARHCWIRVVQFIEFEKDISDLKAGKSLHLKSRLLCLNPFLCKNGLLRVGGRLQSSTLSFNEKHPIIMPSKHHLTHLVVTQAHHATLHGGQLLMLSYLRKTYWIINARNTIRQIVHKCLTCFKYKSQSVSQLMSELPAPRSRISRPFTHTGVDYAGPISVRVSKGRNCKTFKGYIAIFVCLCTKAIHLEAVSDQTSAAFLAALKRFIARRGICSHVYSDCGTNFVGANKQLQGDYLRVIHDSNKAAAAALATQGLTWHFIPPASPHFGGLWEAGVKSMKHHLRRILGEINLTFEELTTVLSQIEACLNSRPLCPLSTDPEDLSVLTPGHFLIGDSLLAPPEPELLDIKGQMSSRWQLTQQLYQQFWRRWQSEYLSRLQERPKWVRKTKNIEIGNIVLIKDERSPPTQWPLGRVIALFPGRDGLVRVVNLKTRTGILKRPIVKLSLLPIADNYEPNTIL